MERHACMAAVLCFLTLVPASVASADVIYGSLVFAPGPSAFNADVFVTTVFEAADDFVLADGDNVVTDIHWWGVYAGGNAFADDDFHIRIFADNGGVPADTPSVLDLHPVTVARVDTGVDSADLDLYAYSAEIAPLTLSPDTVYYLSIFNNTPGDSDNWFWLGGLDSADSHWGRDSVSSMDWTEAGYGLLFALTDDARVVPEPTGALLVGLGVAGLAWRRRRARA